MVANRDRTAHRARLRMEVASYGRVRTAVLSAEGRTVERRVGAVGVIPIGIDLVLPPTSTTSVTLDARPCGAVRATVPSAIIAATVKTIITVRERDWRVMGASSYV